MPNPQSAKEVHVIRLRRTPLAFFMWGGFGVPLIVLFLIVGIVSLVDNPGHLFPYLMLALTALSLAMWFSSRAVIVNGEVSEGSWLHRRSIPLEEIAEVREGRVGWGQGRVKGIELVPVDGKRSFELRLSSFLTPGRMDEWVKLIEQARVGAEAGSP